MVQGLRYVTEFSKWITCFSWIRFLLLSDLCILVNEIDLFVLAESCNIGRWWCVLGVICKFGGEMRESWRYPMQRFKCFHGEKMGDVEEWQWPCNWGCEIYIELGDISMDANTETIEVLTNKNVMKAVIYTHVCYLLFCKLYGFLLQNLRKV